MRVAIVQLAYDDDEPRATRVERVAQLVRDQAGHDLVVLPELWQPTGFGYRHWAELAEPVDGPLVHAMARAARDAGVVLHAGSWIETNGAGPDGRGLWNTSMVFGPDGALLATYRKVHRFGFGAGGAGAARGRAGDRDRRPAVASARERAESGSVTTGLATCYDIRFPEQFRRLLDAGATAVRRTGSLAGCAGRALAAARAGPGAGEPVVHGAVQHRGHACGRRDGRRAARSSTRGEPSSPRPASTRTCSRSTSTSTRWPRSGTSSPSSPTAVSSSSRRGLRPTHARSVPVCPVAPTPDWHGASPCQEVCHGDAPCQ